MPADRLNETLVQNTIAHVKRARAQFLPTSKQICSGENCGELALKRLWPCWTHTKMKLCPTAGGPFQRTPSGNPPVGPADYTQTSGATPRKVFRIPESVPRVNEKNGKLVSWKPFSRLPAKFNLTPPSTPQTAPGNASSESKASARFCADRRAPTVQQRSMPRHAPTPAPSALHDGQSLPPSWANRS